MSSLYTFVTAFLIEVWQTWIQMQDLDLMSIHVINMYSLERSQKRMYIPVCTCQRDLILLKLQRLMDTKFPGSISRSSGHGKYLVLEIVCLSVYLFIIPH